LERGRKGLQEGGYLIRARKMTTNWDSLSTKQQDVKGWTLLLQEINHEIEIVPVEFIEYDEDLYQALVKGGCSNGQVSIDYDQLGPV
jgi:hypothetical protein